MSNLIQRPPWYSLRDFTPARIALGRTGSSLPTQASLDFGLAHARARDAVHVPLDVQSVQRQLAEARVASILVQSAAPDRERYLRRPDLGRRLDESSRASLLRTATDVKPPLALVIADGLSAAAAERQAVPLLRALQAQLRFADEVPVVVALQARVALGDEIGELLGAQQIIVLIGERPGLSSHDSLGAYLTHDPRVGRTDAERNCVSNIRAEGLSYEDAAHRLALLLRGAKQLGASGVALKDESTPELPLLTPSSAADGR